MANFIKLRNIPFRLAVLWLAVVLIAAVTAPWWPVPAPDRIDPELLAAPPGAAHLLGTDSMGRDIGARLLFGSRVSLVVGFCAPFTGMLLGVLLGIPAGFYRGRYERFVLFLLDTLLAFPGLIFLLVFTFIVGASLPTITVGLGILIAPRFARVARANTIRFAEREFVLAARGIGASDFSIIMREILPNLLTPLLVYMLLSVGYVIIAEGGLSFLGLSVPAPAPSWGGMIAGGRDLLDQAPHICLIPTLVMFLTVLSVNLIGDQLRPKLDSRESRL
ncbi:glutathione transport system permease protein GsiD [Geobacter sp. OR-1]|uniref:ABC transporter permease n=1 Tax=Geobacter sp. OR-1 TaxID=1266765 RepID=UPI00054196D8|nr:ABC transporter permease [Geobacter sp. OR-1]GAM11136.1 glutathione transport system permease protein GsiD [Geobacter sp. OR-1]